MQESPVSAVRYMRLTALFLLAHAVILLGQGGWMFLNHKPHEPNYHNHHVHDACHSLAFVLGALLAFYAVIVFLIAFTKEAKSESWALRVLGLPNLVFVLYTMVVLGALAYQFNLHDEHWFSLTLELGCIGALFFASYFLLTFATHGLGNLRGYAPLWTLILSVPICSVGLLFFYEGLPIHKYLGLATLVPYVMTLITSQRSKVEKVLKKL